MLSHPWTELQLLIKEKWLTQKAFSAILWKKVSEVNELLKWKRNITIQRDYLLHQTLWTPIKYWILKQIDYEYSLIDIDDKKESPFDKGDGEQSEPGGFSASRSSSWASAKDLMWKSEEQNTQDSSSSLHSSSEWQINTQETPTQEQKNEIDEDFKNRVKIFRNF